MVDRDAIRDHAAGWISREEHLRIVEQINRARRLEASVNFQSGRRYERESRMGVTGTNAYITEVIWSPCA